MKNYTYLPEEQDVKLLGVQIGELDVEIVESPIFTENISEILNHV